MKLVEILQEKYCIRKSDIEGRGVFATTNIKEGELFLKISGEIVGDGDNEMLLQIGDNKYLGPSGKADDYLNHSCNPNCGVVSNDEGYFFKAIRQINRNEELVWDYSTSVDDDWVMACKCGSKECRGEIGSFSSLPFRLKDKYIKLGIVLPYLLG